MEAKKPVYKRVWFWIVIAVVVVAIAGGAAGGGGTQEKTADIAPADSASSSAASSTSATEEAAVKEEPEVPTEYTSALKKAQSYSDTMHMSKAGLYDQLTSEYGEQFSAEAAQYAVDNVNADWNANALAKAKSYQDTMSMSPEAPMAHSKYSVFILSS